MKRNKKVWFMYRKRKIIAVFFLRKPIGFSRKKNKNNFKSAILNISKNLRNPEK